MLETLASTRSNGSVPLACTITFTALLSTSGTILIRSIAAAATGSIQTVRQMPVLAV